MLTGQYNHNIDPKGRLIIPAKFRDDLGAEFMVMNGLDGCLFLYSMKEWENFAARLNELSQNTKPELRKFIRYYIGSADKQSFDKQGRILISSSLRKHAGLEKDVVLVGVLDRVEIWDKAKWDANNADVEEHMDELIQEMEALGFSI